MKTIHSPACYRKISDWSRQPRESSQYRLASFVYGHTDVEIRDLLVTILADDPDDSDAVAAARELWPLLVIGEPFHIPEELQDELADLTRDYEMLRLRTQALAAKFRALEPWSERWNRYPHADAEFGELNIDWTVRALGSVASIQAGFVAEQLAEAREYAAKLHVYDTEAVSS